MHLDWVSLVDFRSYPGLEWRPDTGVNLLVGPNGAGKTNLLEAVAYIGTLKSFRSAPDEALVADDAGSAVVRAAVSSGGRDRLVEIEVPRIGPRRTQVDKAKLGRTTELLGVLRVVAFLPEDLDLVKRGPAHRRDLLDAAAVQLWPASHLDQAEYERSLRQRNAFLRQGDRDDDTLAVWDARLAQAGGRVLARRARVIEILRPLLGKAYSEVTRQPSETEMSYTPTWPGRLDQASAAEFAERLGEALERSRRVDYERKMTTVGPHRDEPGFLLDGHDARVHGSQGEQRTMALAVKLAAHQAVADTIGEPPLLLLDDVFSELDPSRAAALADALPDDTQTLITSARPDEVPVVGKVWQVGEGTVR